MDAVLFEQLLYEEESDSLDFKRDQYQFDKGNDIQKGELLKDILAFANSWKRSEGYILIGVKEVKGGKSNLVGITDDLDDAILQQFVNGKTNKPLTFSYRPFIFDGKRFGIVKIPVQARPFYIKQDFGKLEKERVYIRRGSSTDIAKPEEIILMGKTSVESPKPSVDLEFANKDSKEKLGKNLKINCIVFNYDRSKIKLRGKSPLQFAVFYENENYYKEKADYIYQSSIHQKVGFWIKNSGDTLLSNVSVKIFIKCEENIIIQDGIYYPKYPEKTENYLFRPNLSDLKLNPIFEKNRIDVTVERKKTNKHWLIKADFGDIRPKEEVWSNDFFCVGATESLKLEIESLVFADNLPEPIKIPLSFEFEVNKEDLDFEKLYND